MGDLDCNLEQQIRDAYVEAKAGQGKPWFVVAQSLGIELFDFYKCIRRKIEPSFRLQVEEKEFIIQNADKIPRWRLAEMFDLRPHDFSNLSRSTGVSFAKEDDIPGLVKWLVEQELKLKLDDDLPYQITDGVFRKHRLTGIQHKIYRMQETNKELSYFSSTYVAIDLAYPDVYKPWQFRHLKTAYWKDKDLGKLRLATALRWLVEEKQKIRSESINALKNTRGFIKSKDLEFYHLRDAFGFQFTSQQEWIDYTYPSDSDRVRREDARKLRETLKASGRVNDRCEICGSEQTHVHHIILVTRGGGNETENLICLCPNHHDQAHRGSFDNLVLQANVGSSERVKFFVSLYSKRLVQETKSVSP